MPAVFADNTGAVVSPGGTTTSDTSWTVSSVTGFPSALAAGDWFHVADVNPAQASEKIKVTAISGSTWTVTRGDEGTTAVAHTAGFSVAQVVTAGDLGELTQTYNAKSPAFGAKGDGVTDDTTAIQNALNAAGALNAARFTGGATVSLPPGTFMTSGLTIPQNVTLRGAGAGATILMLTAGAAAHAFLLTNAQLIGTSYDADNCQAYDMTLDGNMFNVTAPSPWQCGLVFQTRHPTGNFEYNDARHKASNLIIQNFTGDGLVQWHQGVCQFSDIQVWTCNGFGVVGNQDSQYSNIDVGGCGLDGFLIEGGSNKLSNCKAWFCGASLTSSRTTGATALTVNPGPNPWDGSGLTGFTYSLASGFGNGLLLRDLTGTGAFSTNVGGNYGGGVVSAFIAQDNARAGFSLHGGRWSFEGIQADSNSNCGCTTGTTPLASFAGIELPDNDCFNSTVSGVSWDRGANTNHQQAAVYSGVGNSGLDVRVATAGKLNDGVTPLPLLLSGSTVPPYQVLLVFNGVPVDSSQWEALTSGFTLANSTSAQQLLNGTASGALTVAASTAYYFECLFSLSGLSSSTHGLSFGFGGTATYTSVMYEALTSTSSGGAASLFQNTTASATAVTASGTATTLFAKLTGIVRVNAGGTLVPQVTQTTASAAAVVAANSYFRAWPTLATNSGTSIGNWS